MAAAQTGFGWTQCPYCHKSVRGGHDCPQKPGAANPADLDDPWRSAPVSDALKNDDAWKVPLVPGASYTGDAAVVVARNLEEGDLVKLDDGSGGGDAMFSVDGWSDCIDGDGRGMGGLLVTYPGRDHAPTGFVPESALRRWTLTPRPGACGGQRYASTDFTPSPTPSDIPEETPLTLDELWEQTRPDPVPGPEPVSDPQWDPDERQWNVDLTTGARYTGDAVIVVARNLSAGDHVVASCDGEVRTLVVDSPWGTHTWPSNPGPGLSSADGIWFGDPDGSGSSTFVPASHLQRWTLTPMPGACGGLRHVSTGILARDIPTDPLPPPDGESKSLSELFDDVFSTTHSRDQGE